MLQDASPERGIISAAAGKVPCERLVTVCLCPLVPGDSDGRYQPSIPSTPRLVQVLQSNACAPCLAALPRDLTPLALSPALLSAHLRLCLASTCPADCRPFFSRRRGVHTHGRLECAPYGVWQDDEELLDGLSDDMPSWYAKESGYKTFGELATKTCVFPSRRRASSFHEKEGIYGYMRYTAQQWISTLNSIY